MTTLPTPISLDQVADQIERLLLCYEELRRTNSLLQNQLQDAVSERDLLKSRLAAARARLDAVLERLPETATTASTNDAELASSPATASATDANNTNTNAATASTPASESASASASVPASTHDTNPGSTMLRQSIAHAWSKSSYGYAAPSSNQEQS